MGRLFVPSTPTHFLITKTCICRKSVAVIKKWRGVWFMEFTTWSLHYIISRCNKEVASLKIFSSRHVDSLWIRHVTLKARKISMFFRKGGGGRCTWLVLCIVYFFRNWTVMAVASGWILWRSLQYVVTITKNVISSYVIELSNQGYWIVKNTTQKERQLWKYWRNWVPDNTFSYYI